jgi:asparagine synthase (glutamine-hydrolysing)
MSLIFGILKKEGDRVVHEELLRLAGYTRDLAPDGTFLRACGHLGVGYQPFHTTGRSRVDEQPGTDIHGNVLLFDGRLDNAAELDHALESVGLERTDTQLILSSFVRWGEDSFSRLIGDWALALWCREQRKLYLARDHAGTRQLHFAVRRNELVWSTTLHTLLGGVPGPEVSRRYAARFLAGEMIWDETPFAEISAVPPAHCVVISADHARSILHWRPARRAELHYRTSDEYDQQFLELFRTSVERRIRPGAGILAHLSGGMDSSSIVCIADESREKESSLPIDTLSFFDDTEPHWDERPYFLEVERKRRRQGVHIDVGAVQDTLGLCDRSCEAMFYPSMDGGKFRLERAIREKLGRSAHRVLLSGVGGDELLGGVPTPIPELADLLVAGKLNHLIARGTEWSIYNRTPLLQILWRTLRTVTKLYVPPYRRRVPPPWIGTGLKKLLGCPDILRSRPGSSSQRPGPGGIIRWETWWTLADSLAHATPSPILRLETRYPYLDRDLVDFLLRVPYEELCAPGRRRAMMRRALKGIVPDMILERRRKAYVSRRPLALLRESVTQIEELFANPNAAEYGFVDPAVFRTCLATALSGDTKWMRPLLATIAYEVFLRGCHPEENSLHVSREPASTPSSTSAKTAVGWRG